MAVPRVTPPRPDTIVPPVASNDVVVPIRPKPPASPVISNVMRPVIIEEDVIEYLVRAPVEQRWRILSRVALATHDELAPASAAPPPGVPPAPRQPMVVVPAPASQRPQLELVDQTREAEPPPPAPSVAPPPPASVAPPPVSSVVPQRLAYSAPPPPPPQKSATDPAEKLFEAMHELTLLESGPAGASYCLRVALAAVPCLAGLVHLRDPKTLELVVVHAEGPRAEGVLQTRTPLTDSLVVRAARAGRPTVATYGAEPDAEKAACPRHTFFDPWSVVVVPVMHGGQLLGLLEMIDPIDGNPTGEQAQGALSYVAERLGGFLAERAAGLDSAG